MAWRAIPSSFLIIEKMFGICIIDDIGYIDDFGDMGEMNNMVDMGDEGCLVDMGSLGFTRVHLSLLGFI